MYNKLGLEQRRVENSLTRGLTEPYPDATPGILTFWNTLGSHRNIGCFSISLSLSLSVSLSLSLCLEQIGIPSICDERLLPVYYQTTYPGLVNAH